MLNVRKKRNVKKGCIGGTVYFLGKFGKIKKIKSKWIWEWKVKSSTTRETEIWFAF